MGNWIDKLARLPHKQDGSLISGAVEPALHPQSSRAGIWYETPYDFLPEFDLLWVCQAFIDLKVYAFTAAQAAASPTSPPQITLTLPDPEPGNPNPVKVSAVGFAPNGDMWVGYNNSNGSGVNQGRFVSKVSASKLAATGSVAPDFSFQLVAASVATHGVSAIAFASNGDLFVSTAAEDVRPSGILRYSAASVASPGSPTPAAVLAQPFPPVPDNPGHSHSANDLWFDASGNLWFCNAVAGTVNRLSAAQLATTNTAIVPDIVLAINSHTGVTMDAVGNLWCATAGGTEVHMYAAVSITASGAPTPARTITVPAGVAKLRFDKSGNLWVQGASFTNAYAPSDISVSGAPTPRTVLTGGGSLTSRRMLAFNPANFA